MSVLLEENKRRNQILDAHYNPYLGIGSPIERQLFTLKDSAESLYLPMSMMNVSWVQTLAEIGSFYDFFKQEGKKHEPLALCFTKDQALDTLESVFMNERLDHDFEYWAALCITIFDKDTFEPHKFILRGAQRNLLLVLEGMRLAGVPIRVVLLKARQWGGSTLVQFYMMWIQQRLKENWHMAVCAQQDDAANNISNMYTKAAENYPEAVGSITLKPFAKSSKNRICVETGGIIGVGSVNNPDQFRSYNYAMAHLSEVGVWQDTPKRSASNLVTSLKEAVPDQPLTVVVEESTAKGLNYFYESWLKAVKGETRYQAVFVPWFDIDRCRIPVEKPEKFVKTWTNYEKYQWQIGATIEGIAWYRSHKADKGYSDWMMMQENPGTAEEAFQSSGQKVFPPAYVQALRNDNVPPIFIGDVYGDARMGADALKNIRLEAVINGNLRAWKLPEQNETYKNRYVVIVDIGGTTDKADNSVISVIDRIGMISVEGYIEGILTWAGHTDQDILAWKAVQIAKMYDNALLVIEANSLKKKKEEEGDHFLTILNQIKDYYFNLYIRNNEERVGDDFVPKYGFQTDSKSKGLAINAFKAAARERYLLETNEDDGYYLIEYDKEVCDEASWYETKTDGSQGAIQGKRDDRLITRAIGAHIAINIMPLPELKQAEVQRRTGKYKKTESNF